MVMADGRGTTWLAQVVEKWRNELADDCKGLLVADRGPSWRIFFPSDITHKMLGNKEHCPPCLFPHYYDLVPKALDS